MKNEINENEFWRLHDRTKERFQTLAMEALQDIFHRIPFGEEIKFSDGRVGVIRPFFQPRIDMERNDHLGKVPCAGVDIVFDDGHLEFIIFQGGWEGEVIPEGEQ